MSSRFVPFLTIIFVYLLTASPSQAMRYRSFDLKNEQAYFATGSIDAYEALPPFNTNWPTSITFTTGGGSVDGKRRLINELGNVALMYKKAGQRLTFKFEGRCSSACLTLIAFANALAKEHLVEVSAKKSLELGFHGCYVGVQRNEACTSEMKRELVTYGVSSDWIEARADLFAQTSIKDHVRKVKITSRELREAGFTTEFSFY